MDNTFTYKPVEHDGRTFYLASANEYPWLNVQIITFPEDEHDESIEKIKSHHIGWVVEHPGRRDFAVIHAGGDGGGKLQFTQENYQQITSDMQECLRNAAAWWAKHEK